MILPLVLLFISFAVFLFFFYSPQKYISSIENAPFLPYTLVLGAGIKRDGTPTDILADRVLTACKLYHAKKTETLIMSGTNHTQDYDETEAMMHYALKQNVPNTAIRLDGSGYTTFQSCVNMMRQFKSDQFFIVTQGFHLPRAILIARALKMKPMGIAANFYRFSYLKKFLWSVRELFAMPINFVRIMLFRDKS